jgi:CpeT protein
MRRTFPALFALCLIAPVSLAQQGGASPNPAATSDAAARDGLDTLLKFMTGSFSSQEQSQADPENYFDIRLEMVPIWTDRTDGRWLYVEQAAASSLEKPYRQRIYCVTEPKPGEFVSAVYELPGDPLAFAGAFKDPGKLKDLSPKKLTARDGCSIVLHRAQDGTFNGATDGTGCVSTLRGAAYATSEAHIGPDGLRTWDRGYDKDSKQVWGAQKGPYIFKRVK